MPICTLFQRFTILHFAYKYSHFLAVSIVISYIDVNVFPGEEVPNAIYVAFQGSYMEGSKSLGIFGVDVRPFLSERWAQLGLYVLGEIKDNSFLSDLEREWKREIDRERGASRGGVKRKKGKIEEGFGQLAWLEGDEKISSKIK